MLLKPIKQPAVPLRVGMLLKSPLDGKVRRVAWLDDQRGEVWVIHETSSYGWLGPLHPPLWDYCEEFRPKKRIDGKMVEMTDEMITEAWANPDWKVGDLVSQHQREFTFEIIATGPSCVLTRNLKTGTLCVDSNSNLEKYYKREIKELGSGW